MISVSPPPEYAFVGNPVFVTVTADRSDHTILLDVVRGATVIYTAAAPSVVGQQNINISEILESFIFRPLPWPLPAERVSGIANWLTSYYIEVREMAGATMVDFYTSPIRYACPGALPDNIYKPLAAANTDIFTERLFNPAVNRFMTVYAGADASEIVLPECAPAILSFIVKAGETMTLTMPENQTYDFTFENTALYLINLSEALSARDTASVRFGTGKTITIRFEPLVASWPVRAWLFLNHFGVFEPFFTTGRFQSFISRPDNPARRYVPALDAFRPIGLPSTRENKIKFNSGNQTPANMKIFSLFAISDLVFLIVGAAVVYYVITQAVERLSADDNREPNGEDLEGQPSAVDPDTPVFIDKIAIFTITPIRADLPWTAGETIMTVSSVVNGKPADWTFEYTPTLHMALNALVVKISDTELKVTYPVNGSASWRSGAIRLTQTATGDVITADLVQKYTQRIFYIDPNALTVQPLAGMRYVTVTNTADGGEQLGWSIRQQDDPGVTWCSAEKISDTQARISWASNPSNIARGPIIFLCQSTEFDSAVTALELKQLASGSPSDVYDFRIHDSGGWISSDGVDGRYVLNLPSSARNYFPIGIISTRNENMQPWSPIIIPPIITFHQQSGNEMVISLAENLSEENKAGVIVFQQSGSDAYLYLTVNQAAPGEVLYNFFIQGGHFHFEEPGVLTRTIISSSSERTAEPWVIDHIEYIDGGQGWFQTQITATDLSVTVTSENPSTVRRWARIYLRQTNSGLTDSRNITHAGTNG